MNDGRSDAAERDRIMEERVKAANRRFYDAIAKHYEELDGRRSTSLEDWLRGILAELRLRGPGGRLLDIGAGSGLVTRCAKGVFALRVGVDISPKILSASSQAFDTGVAADVDRLPFADGCFDVVTCFAVLHHLYAVEGLVSEVARVLKDGGVFYSDHDMDLAFYRRFRVLLGFYRRFRNARKKYRRASEAITEGLYDLTEWREDGLDSSALIRTFEAAGFSVEPKFHWFGLNPISDRLFGKRSRAQKSAPLISLVAIKGKLYMA